MGVPDRLAHLQLMRDLDAWLRLQFLGVASHTGIARALIRPGTTVTVAGRADLSDHELVEAVLRLGISLGEVGERHGHFRITGRHLRAVADRSVDLGGLVEELVTYDAPIHSRLLEHLRGAPKAGYLDGVAGIVARASRVAEPVLAPTVRAVVRTLHPKRILDVGCGTGVYLRHVLEAAPDATGVGIDLEADSISAARATLSGSPAADRCRLLQVDLNEMAPADQSFDLVLLLQNIYYWAPTERPGVFRQLRELGGGGGTLVVASGTPEGPAMNRHLDLVLRVTEGCWRLPTADELGADLHEAGFVDIELVEPVPRTGLVVAVAS